MALQQDIFNGIIVDNFAGGGGASTGIKQAIGRDVDIAINHDPAAIAIHKANHPYTQHLTVVSRDRFGLVVVGGINYQISDIGMRMLEPRELYNAQGFPPDYIIDRDYSGKTYPKSEQVAKCGNSVPPAFAEALVRANLPELCRRAA